MAGLRKKRRIQLIIIGFVFLAAATTLIGFGIREGAQYFRRPSQVLAAPPPPQEMFRIGGQVAHGSLERSGATIRFVVRDEEASVAVRFRGVLPDLFREGELMIATGRLVDGTFEATEILAKHDENYRPKELEGMFVEDAKAQPPDQ